jgi:hypothetical protein
VSSKPNWACSSCRMWSGRRESVLRHITNPRIHDGRAIPIPYLEYVAGFQNGLYGQPAAYQYFRRNRNIHQGMTMLTERTYLDKFAEKYSEKAIEKLADNAVEFAFGQNRTLIPSQRPNQKAFSARGFYFSKKRILGMGGYVCRSCMTLNAHNLYLLLKDRRHINEFDPSAMSSL